MITVGVAGASGRMGRLVADAVTRAEDLTLAARFDPAGGEGVSADPDVLAGCAVVVEFTNPAVVLGNLRRWHEMGASAVVGTSGFDAGRLDELRTLWTHPTARCLVVPNFSIGAVLMMRMAEMASPFFAAADIVELHHDDKVDAPSGTAVATARRMESAGVGRERAVRSTEEIAGALGAEVGGVPIHSVRLPGLVAHQQVMFGSSGETLTIRHDTTDRASFMPGVLLAIRGVEGLADPVTVGLEALLGV